MSTSKFQAALESGEIDLDGTASMDSVSYDRFHMNEHNPTSKCTV